MNPISNRRRSDSQPSPQDVPRLDGLRVLIVDDEEDTRDLVGFILRDVGASVRQTADARDAYAIVEEWSPDVIVSDLRMSSEDGYTFIKNVRARAPRQGGQIPAVAITGLTGDAVKMTALDAGYQNFVRKPIQSAELIAVLASLTWQARLARRTPSRESA